MNEADELALVEAVFWSMARMAAMELRNEDHPNHQTIEACRLMIAEAMSEEPRIADTLANASVRLVRMTQTQAPEDAAWWQELSVYLGNIVKQHVSIPSAAARAKLRRAVAGLRGE